MPETVRGHTVCRGAARHGFEVSSKRGTKTCYPPLIGGGEYRTYGFEVPSKRGTNTCYLPLIGGGEYRTCALVISEMAAGDE